MKILLDTSSISYDLKNWNFGGIVIENMNEDNKDIEYNITFHQTNNIKEESDVIFDYEEYTCYNSSHYPIHSGFKFNELTSENNKVKFNYTV